MIKKSMALKPEFWSPTLKHYEFNKKNYSFSFKRVTDTNVQK